MIYLVALLLILAIIFETLFLRKGLKSAKKNSAHLRSDHAVPLSSRSNKRANSSSGAPLPETTASEELVSQDADYFKNVVEFPDRKSTGRESSFSDGLRHSAGPDSREKSVHDMIQEIRGGKLLPRVDTELSETVEVDDEKSDEYEEVLEYEELPAEDEIAAEESFDSKETDALPLNATIEDDEFSTPAEDEAAPEVEDDALETLEDLEEAEIVPSPEELLKNGIRCVRQGKLDEGIAALEQAVASAPEKAEAHFNLGIAYTLQEFYPLGNSRLSKSDRA